MPISRQSLSIAMALERHSRAFAIHGFSAVGNQPLIGFIGFGVGRGVMVSPLFDQPTPTR